MMGALIGRLLTGEAGAYFAKLKSLAILYAVLGLLGFFAVAFLFGALFAWLASLYGGVATSLGFAVLMLLLCGVTAVVIGIAKRPRRRRTDEALRRDMASMAGVAALSNAPMLFAAVRKRRGLLVLPAVAMVGLGAWRLLDHYRHRGI
ncbi:hypothetical protein [Aurantimonas sp. Leaf443]|uniref:hypothetical protein n=1 Tax=Aurantimonas sp. Leaf443 TaxID=1736378 RepID=UPI0006F6BCAC|nr:hypothetical protein [Aurantimonas sp. Leaf443]